MRASRLLPYGRHSIVATLAATAHSFSGYRVSVGVKQGWRARGRDQVLKNLNSIRVGIAQRRSMDINPLATS